MMFLYLFVVWSWSAHGRVLLFSTGRHLDRRHFLNTLGCDFNLLILAWIFFAIYCHIIWFFALLLYFFAHLLWFFAHLLWFFALYLDFFLNILAFFLFFFAAFVNLFPIFVFFFAVLFLFTGFNNLFNFLLFFRKEWLFFVLFAFLILLQTLWVEIIRVIILLVRGILHKWVFWLISTLWLTARRGSSFLHFLNTSWNPLNSLTFFYF